MSEECRGNHSIIIVSILILAPFIKRFKFIKMIITALQIKRSLIINEYNPYCSLLHVLSTYLLCLVSKKSSIVCAPFVRGGTNHLCSVSATINSSSILSKVYRRTVIFKLRVITVAFSVLPRMATRCVMLAVNSTKWGESDALLLSLFR